MKRSPEVVVTEPVNLGAQFRAFGSIEPQRVKIGDKVSAHSVLSNQVVDTVLDPCEPESLVGRFVAGRTLAAFGPVLVGHRAIGFLLVAGATDHQELLEVLTPSFGDASSDLERTGRTNHRCSPNCSYS